MNLCSYSAHILANVRKNLDTVRWRPYSNCDKEIVGIARYLTVIRLHALRFLHIQLGQYDVLIKFYTPRDDLIKYYMKYWYCHTLISLYYYVSHFASTKYKWSVCKPDLFILHTRLI